MNKKTHKVFLGGTCNKTIWREEVIKMLSDKIDYFDPVVKIWNEKAQEEEERQKQICDIHLYVRPTITA